VIPLRTTVTTDTDKTAKARPRPRPRPVSINAPDQRLTGLGCDRHPGNGPAGGFEYVTPGLNPSPNCV